jgi:nitrite reductase (NADH) large subunit
MRIAIIGCGVAGVTAARAIRQSAGSEHEVTVYTDENHLYYPRPRLYEVLSGERQPQEIYSYAPKWYEKLGIKVQLGKKVVRIDPANKEIIFEGGLKANYDKLLLANGAQAFVPSIAGIEKKGTFTLRNLDDAITIKQYATKTRETIVIGGGLLGIEFADCLIKLGQKVEVVEIFPRLLPRQLDQDGSSILENDLRKLGIGMQLGVKTTEILGKETVTGVALDNEKEVLGELILISAGVRSDIRLAADAGIKVNKGVIVDDYLRTSADEVYAAGDVLEFHTKAYGIIPPAIDQARVAAANMLEGEKHVYNGTTEFTTLKIAGISLTSMGLVSPEGPKYEEIKRIDKQRGVYKKIVLDQGKIVGAILLGNRNDTSTLTRLMQQEIDVTKYKNHLLEDDFDYKQIT